MVLCASRVELTVSYTSSPVTQETHHHVVKVIAVGTSAFEAEEPQQGRDDGKTDYTTDNAANNGTGV